jgi:hypothetical protein
MLSHKKGEILMPQSKAHKVPASAAGEAAAILGNGDGMQKLCYVLFLAEFDDKLAARLADVGSILAAARALMADGSRERTAEEKVVLATAYHLESTLCQAAEWPRGRSTPRSTGSGWCGESLTGAFHHARRKRSGRKKSDR